MNRIQDSLKTKIMDYISKSWKFRIKNVGEHNYIICYKEGKEKSLGPYNNKIWKFIEKNGGKKPNVIPKETQYIKQITKLKEQISHLESFEENAALVSEKCPHIATWSEFTYCTSLSWEKKPNKIMQINPKFKFKQMNLDHDKNKWYVHPHKDLCRTCMMFPKTPLNIKENLDNLSRIVNKLKNDVYTNTNLLKQLKKSARRKNKEGYECINIQPDGYCNKWRNYKRNLDLEQKEETILKNNKSITVYRDNVKKNPLLCASCPSYKMKK